MATKLQLEEEMPMSMTGLPPRPPSESIQHIYPVNDDDEEDQNEIEDAIQERPTLQDEVRTFMYTVQGYVYNNSNKNIT